MHHRDISKCCVVAGSVVLSEEGTARQPNIHDGVAIGELHPDARTCDSGRGFEARTGVGADATALTVTDMMVQLKAHPLAADVGRR